MAFNSRKAAQATAYFALRQGGSINVLKLVKLLYLADRAFLKKYDRPILYDWLVSMDHGPVNSCTLNYINGLSESDGWSEFVTDRAGHEIGVARKSIDVEGLDEFSDAELDMLDHTWRKYGHMTQYQIRDFTHKNCPEWENPRGTSYPIPYERVLKFLGKKDCDELAQRVDDARNIDLIFGELST